MSASDNYDIISDLKKREAVLLQELHHVRVALSAILSIDGKSDQISLGNEYNTSPSYKAVSKVNANLPPKMPLRNTIDGHNTIENFDDRSNKIKESSLNNDNIINGNLLLKNTANDINSKKVVNNIGANIPLSYSSKYIRDGVSKPEPSLKAGISGLEDFHFFSQAQNSLGLGSLNADGYPVNKYVKKQKPNVSNVNNVDGQLEGIPEVKKGRGRPRLNPLPVNQLNLKGNSIDIDTKHKMMAPTYTDALPSGSNGQSNWLTVKHVPDTIKDTDQTITKIQVAIRLLDRPAAAEEITQYIFDNTTNPDKIYNAIAGDIKYVLKVQLRQGSLIAKTINGVEFYQLP